jgi:hypothetical protein
VISMKAVSAGPSEEFGTSSIFYARPGPDSEEGSGSQETLKLLQ